MGHPKLVPPGQRIALRLTTRERSLVLERAFISPDLAKCFRLAVSEGGKLLVNLTLDDVDELAGAVAAEANHAADPKMAKQFYSLHDRLVRIEETQTDAAEAEPPLKQDEPNRTARFTAKQGQYLAFIHYYTKIHGVAPAEADLQRYFKVSGPAVHQMVLSLEKRGLIRRVPGQARSICVLLSRHELPDLE